MHSFVIPQAPDLPVSPDTLHIHPDTSIGITEIRSVQAFLSKKPIQSAQNVVIIHDAHLLTLPAQQAFLKTLEEPPAASLIYLVTSQPDTLLPTILSRCQVDQSSSSTATPSEVEPSGKILHQLLSASVGDRLALLDTQNFTRDSALAFLDHLEFYLHSQITYHLEGVPDRPPSRWPTDPPDINHLYDLIVATRRYLKANVSVRLALDHLAFNL